VVRLENTKVHAVMHAPSYKSGTAIATPVAPPMEFNAKFQCVSTCYSMSTKKSVSSVVNSSGNSSTAFERPTWNGMYSIFFTLWQRITTDLVSFQPIKRRFAKWFTLFRKWHHSRNWSEDQHGRDRHPYNHQTSRYARNALAPYDTLPVPLLWLLWR